MSSNKKILKAGSLYFIGNIFDKAVAFITIPIFTRMLSTTDYGVTNTYLSWVSILSVVITLSLGNSIRTAVVDYPDKKNEYMSAIFALGTISAFLMTVVLCVGGWIIGGGTSIKLILLCCLHSYATSIIATVQWRHMMDVEYIKRTVLQCVPNLIVIFLSVIFIAAMNSDKYLGRVYAYALVYGMIGVFYLIFCLAKGKVLINKEYWSYALKFSLPVIFHSLSTVILSQADRTMITELKNASETGIYSLAYQFGMVPLVVTTTFENMWIPWFTNKMQEGDKKSINQMVRPYINCAALLCIGIVLVAPEVLRFMSTPEYYSGEYMIGPVILATFLMFLASISLDLEYYLKQTKTIAGNTITAAVINIVLNFIFIPQYGGIAAAYTTVVAYGISFLMHYRMARKLDGELFPLRIYVLPVVLNVVAVLLVNQCMELVWIRWGLAVVTGIFALYMLVSLYKKKGQ